MGDALALTMTVEVKSIRNITNSSRPKPVLRIETALCEVGPWVAVPFASADGISDPDNYTVNIPMLGESPEIVALKPSLGFVRWAVSDSLMTTDNDEWDVCFRIVAVPTNFQ